MVAQAVEIGRTRWSGVIIEVQIFGELGSVLCTAVKEPWT